MKKSGIVLIVSMVILAACSDPESGSTSSPSPVADNTSASTSIQRCLAKVAETPCQLLTEDMVKPYAPDEAELSRVEQNVAGMQCRYTWQGGRTQVLSAGQFQMEAPLEDSAELGQIELNDGHEEGGIARHFAHRYQQTEQQKAQAAENAAKAASEQVADEHKDMAKDFAKSLVSKMRYEQVPGLGDDASWGGIGRHKSLGVRVGKTTFTVKVERSDDETARRQDSMALARALLEKCS